MFIDGQQKQTVTLSGAMGLNTSLPPSDINENELSMAYNVWFDAGSGKLVTRGGIVAEDVSKFPQPINQLTAFVRKPDESWLVCVENGKLYYRDGNGWFTLWSTIESEEPQMASFNGKLYVADGSVNGLLTWDGTTVARLANSPQATSVFVANNSLICNSTTELDAVYVSAVETDNFLPGSGASIIRAGFGDGQNVNGFAAISKLLIVSKVSSTNGKVANKTFYSINMEGTPSTWSADYLSNNNAALGPHAIYSVGQDVLYLDTQGIESLEATQNYGDVSQDPTTGGRINSSVMESLKTAILAPKVRYIPNLASTFFIVGYDIYVLSALTGAFTVLDFGTQINDIVQLGDDVYLAGEEGQLYSLSELGTDEVVAGSPLSFSSVVGFKMVSGSGDLLLTRTHMDLEYLVSGTYRIAASSGESVERTTLQTFDFGTSSGGSMLYDATGDLSEATDDLGFVGSSQRIPCRSKYRGDGIALQITTSNGGRLSFGRTTAHITQVGK